MTSHTRRFHPKTRTGCGQCKKRHIKCDGRALRCRNCERRDLACDYSNQTVPTAVNVWRPGYKNLSYYRANFPPKCIPFTGFNVLESPFGGFDGGIKDGMSSSSAMGTSMTANLTPSMMPPPMMTGMLLPAMPATPSPMADMSLQPNTTYIDLQLLCHYTAKTCHSLVKDGPPFKADFWQVCVPEDAQNCQFLMHSLLSLTALHRSNLDEAHEAEFTDLGIKHYNIALRLFREAVTDVSRTTFRPVLASVVLILMVNIVLPTVYARRMQLTLEGLLEPVICLRRSSFFFRSVTLEVGVPEVLAYFRNKEDYPENILNSRIREVLDALRHLQEVIESIEDSEQNKLAYKDALRNLYLAYRVTETGPPTVMQLFRWARVTCQEYFDLLVAHHPMALVIYAHWCVPLYHVSPNWFVGKWPELSIRMVAQILGESWQSSMSWPLQELATPPRLMEVCWPQ